MARVSSRKPVPEPMIIHEDEPEECETGDEETEAEVMEESRDPLTESGCTRSDESDEDVEESVLEDIAQFEASFKGISERYRIVNRIGEGTFSTVYKAEDLHYDRFRNDWDIEEKENMKWSSPYSKKASQGQRKPHFVAIKKIYVTSSPLRIFNELELLHDLRNSESVCPLITAFRHLDQVVAVLPYFQHQDFRDYYRDMRVSDMRIYFRSLFTALRSVHAHGILHRDIKPTNFLYNPYKARGVLVDFGLAERQGSDYHACFCELEQEERLYRVEHSVYAHRLAANPDAPPGYPKADTRPTRRANRAGTRGFRAPEVLLKCTAQTTAIDVWSTGVILLTLLARRFPFFHSTDDIDALLEIMNIFGKRRMRETALLHGQVLDTNIPSYSENGHGFEKIVLWCTNRAAKDEHGKRISNLSREEKEAVVFLERCLECDPAKRITAEEALDHPFITAAGTGESDEDELDLLVS